MLFRQLFSWSLSDGSDPSFRDQIEFPLALLWNLKVHENYSLFLIVNFHVY